MVLLLLLLTYIFPSSTSASNGSVMEGQEGVLNSSVTDYRDLQQALNQIHNQAASSKATTQDLDERFEDFQKSYVKEKKKFRVQTMPQIDLTKVNDRRIIVRIKEGEYFNYKNYPLVKQETSKLLQEKGIFLFKVPKVNDYNQTLYRLKQDTSLWSAEPDYLLRSSYVPNDSELDLQWYLNQIHAFDAWNINKGSKDVTIAVLDTGVNKNHPDLAGRVLPGYDFVNDDKDPADDNGHGTHVAGIIVSNQNDMGVAGIDSKANIVPVKVADENGELTTADVTNGIYYAIEQGVDVINMSFGAYRYQKTHADALWEAQKEGIVLVAAAGNESSETFFYPASYTPVISVSATDKQDNPAFFTNYGSYIDIAAPGESIYSTDHNGGYKMDDGTSFSAPMVSAVAGLLIAEQPNWGPEKIEWALQLSSDHLAEEEWDKYVGYGRLNAYEALKTDLPSLNDDVEDSSKKAKELRDGTSYTNRIHLPMDKDWYRLDTKKNTTVTINLQNNTKHLDLVSVLYKMDENGEAVEQHVLDDNLSGANENYTFEAKPGTYKLAIYDFYNHWSMEPYEIKVTTNSTIESDSDTVSFSDTDEHWAEEEILYLAQKGIISGYPDGRFGPNDHIDRASAAKIIVEELKLPIENGHTFKDVPTDHWALGYIEAAAKEGIITGNEDGQFHPNHPLTRAEMAAILTRAYDLKGSAEMIFPDVNERAWSYPYIEKLVANDITTGLPNGKYGPKNKITRGEFAVMITRAIQ
ncbi:S8 family serine peptidase [Oceanobacillus senegalensis]|uniref:S8 family serine peptidase n=1 Tax=Oceanobacillus senegalensis TaxID=1936063 RepID=UPI00117DF309|nr:S8 family serine peptidase [Oceanobacillus senegalensis]